METLAARQGEAAGGPALPVQRGQASSLRDQETLNAMCKVPAPGPFVTAARTSTQTLTGSLWQTEDSNSDA